MSSTTSRILRLKQRSILESYLTGFVVTNRIQSGSLSVQFTHLIELEGAITDETTIFDGRVREKIVVGDYA